MPSRPCHSGDRKACPGIGLRPCAQRRQMQAPAEANAELYVSTAQAVRDGLEGGASPCSSGFLCWFCCFVVCGWQVAEVLLMHVSVTFTNIFSVRSYF